MAEVLLALLRFFGSNSPFVSLEPVPSPGIRGPALRE